MNNASIFVVVIMVVYFWYFFTRLDLNALGMDYSFIRNVFTIFGGTFILILWIQDKIKRKSLRKHWKNSYLLLALLLFGMISIIGFRSISDIYEVQNDFKVNLLTSGTEMRGSASWIYCKTDYDTFIESYDLECHSTLNHHEIEDKASAVIYHNNNNETYLKFDNGEDGNIIFNLSVFEGKNDGHLEYRYKIDGKTHSLYRVDIDFRAIGEDLYFERIHQKMLLIFAVMSFSFVSVLVGVKYLKDIIEGGNNKA